MSELSELIKEMLLGDEPFDPRQSQRSVQEAVAGFERRLSTARKLFFPVTLVMFAGVVWLFVLLLQSDDTASVKTLLLYAMGIILLMSGIASFKTWFFGMHQHTVLLKELKKLEYRLLEARKPEAS